MTMFEGLLRWAAVLGKIRLEWGLACVLLAYAVAGAYCGLAR